METKLLNLTVRKGESRRDRAERRFYNAAAMAALAAAILFLLIAGCTLIQMAGADRPLPEVIQREAAQETEPALPQLPALTLSRALELSRERMAALAPEEEEPEPESRYAPVTEAERDLMAAIVWLEAGNQSFAGQQAVAEVILNRRAAGNFPDTIAGVIYQEDPVQFTTARNIPIAQAGEEQYAAVEAALTGEPVLEADVVYFGRRAQNDNVYAKIGDHYFCRQFEWYYGEG